MAKPRINSRRKGLTFEQDGVRYFRAHQLDARRVVATGYRNSVSEDGDRGDIAFPGFVVQAKNIARPLAGKLLTDVWQETCAQALRTVSVPLLLEKRAGTSDVGRSWLYLDSTTYVRMIAGTIAFASRPHLVRVELGDVIDDIVLMSKELATNTR